MHTYINTPIHNTWPRLYSAESATVQLDNPSARVKYRCVLVLAGREHRTISLTTFMKKALITGITGQDGSYLTELLLEKGYTVSLFVMDHPRRE